MSAVNSVSIDLLCEFLEIAFHYILYIREIYPKSVFKSKRKYGVIVYKSEHPGINEYIEESLKTINFHLKSKQISRILLLFSIGENVVDKFVFSVLSVNNIDSDIFLVKFEDYIRDFLLKLNGLIGEVKNLEEYDDATFSIAVEVNESSAIALNQEPAYEHFPWVHSSESESSYQSEILPIYTLKTDPFDLQVFIEKN